MRAGRPTVVVHVLATDVGPARVGFVVSKAVGGAVVRNRVKRRLRHLAADRLSALAEGSLVVVRALPAAATTPAQLPEDLGRAWSRAAGLTP